MLAQIVGGVWFVDQSKLLWMYWSTAAALDVQLSEAV